MSKQPIHTTLKPQTKPERFELIWSMIEYAPKYFDRSSWDSIRGIGDDDMRSALEIILQCKTFSPGVFERDKNGRWQRAGENPKHVNTEGC